MLGNPDVGNPIAAEHINTLAMTSRLGCGSAMLWPTCWTRGRKIRAATVCEINVATTRIIAANTNVMLYRPKSPTCAVMPSATVCSKPEELTAFPSAKPPAANMMIVHRKLLKSSLVRTPEPKKARMGMMAMTPMSPKTFSSW